jgi:hypothetical protein
MMSLASRAHLDIKEIKGEVDAINGKTDAAKLELDWVKSQTVQFLPLIDMGVDAYNAFEQHKKVYESTMEDLLAGESYTLTKINSFANNLQQQIHDLCNNYRHLPQMAIGTQQHQMATMGQGTWNTTLAMDIRTHQDIPNTGPCAIQEFPPVAKPSGTVPHPTPSVSPVNQSTPHPLNCLIQDA